jgi:hypothetical protein
VSKAHPNFRQNDVSRAIKAARIGGLDIASVEIDKGKITLTVRHGGCIPIEPSRKRDGNEPEPANADTC